MQHQIAGGVLISYLVAFCYWGFGHEAEAFWIASIGSWVASWMIGWWCSKKQSVPPCSV